MIKTTRLDMSAERTRWDGRWKRLAWGAFRGGITRDAWMELRSPGVRCLRLRIQANWSSPNADATLKERWPHLHEGRDREEP